MTTIAPLALLNMKFQMLRASNYLKVTGRVIERVAVNMMNVLIGSQLAPQKALHNQPVFGFVMPTAGHDIAIAVLDVNPGENLSANRLAVASHEGVMIGAKSFGEGWEFAPVNAAHRIFMAVRLLGEKRIAVLVPATVMLAAQALPYTWAVTTIYRAIRFLSWHGFSIAQGR